MGRRQDLPADTTDKLYLRRVPLHDGDYDQGGAYWGGPPSEPLYCAWDAEGRARYVRAGNRQQAKEAVRNEYPNARFFR